MAGLLQSKGTELGMGQNGPHTIGQNGLDPQEEQELEATAEEQAVFEQYVAASIGGILNDPTTFQQLMQAIEASRANPVEGLARLANSMYEKAESKIGPLDDDDISEAVGETIIEELLDLAVEAKLFTEAEVDEDLAAAIYTKMAQAWIEANPDRADPEDMQYIQQHKAAGGHQ